MNGTVAKFDSAGAMARALGRYLQGEDFPAVGASRLAAPFAAQVNRLPERAREAIFGFGGWTEAHSPSRVGRMRDHEIARWFTDCYPERAFPGAVIGSSSGALVHLAAAMGLPWLPQTALIPVNFPDTDPDDPRRGLEQGRELGRELLSGNPDLQLHQMHDPNQDRLMLRHMGYFRLKRRTLGAVYERFLDAALEPGSTLIIAECDHSWPVTSVGPRHYFQFGAPDGATARQYFEGGPEVASYLERYGVAADRWDPPAPDAEAPEAEWGFEPALAADIERFAAERGHRVRRLRFHEPDHLSPLVADLYRWWYRQRGIPEQRLVAESFILLEPYWTLRTGSVPFWMKFNSRFSADALEQYLDRAGRFEEIRVALFPHGTEGVGLAPDRRWRELMARAGQRGEFLGVDPDAYPRDFAALGEFHRALRELAPHQPLPLQLQPLRPSDVDAFLADSAQAYAVDWT